MSARRFKPTAAAEPSERELADAAILDELESLLPADNPAVMKRKALRDLPTKVTSPNVPR